MYGGECQLNTFCGKKIVQQREPQREHIALPRPEGLIYDAQGAAVARVATTRRGDHDGVGCKID